MSASSVTDYSDYYTSTTAKRAQAEKESVSSGKVSHQDFLKLLTTQLTTQDPLNPMQDLDFTAQLAQLQALDEQMAMTKSMTAMRLDTQLQAGTNMIGKYVSGSDTNGDSAAGLVARVLQKDGSVYLELSNKQQMEVGSVTDLWNDSKSMAQDISNSGGVIGKWVDAGYDEGMQPITGIIEKVTVQNGQVFLQLHNGALVTWDQIKELREPSDEDVWNALPQELRDNFDKAKTMIGKTVTGTNADGEEVTGMVANVGLNDNLDSVYLILYNGDTIEYGSLSGDARDPSAADMTAALKGKFVKGLDNESNVVSGLVVDAVENEDGMALRLSNGKTVYYDALTEIREATDAETAAAEQESQAGG